MGFFSNVLGNALHSHIHPSHLDKSEVQLLERHLRLTICAWYTQCMIHSQDKSVCGPPHWTSLSWSPNCQLWLFSGGVGRNRSNIYISNDVSCLHVPRYCLPLHHSGSRWFGAVLHHIQYFNQYWLQKCDWRVVATLLYRAVLSEFRVARPCRTSSNHIPYRGRSTGQFRVSLGWFNHIKPPRTTVMKGEAGRKGSLEWVRGGSTAPNLLEPLWCRGKQAY